MKSFAVIFAKGWAMCSAFDRAEAGTCSFYEPGKEGFCRHTCITKRHEIEERDKWNQKVTRVQLIPDFVDGGCYCEGAILAGRPDVGDKE